MRPLFLSSAAARPPSLPADSSSVCRELACLPLSRLRCSASLSTLAQPSQGVLLALPLARRSTHGVSALAQPMWIVVAFLSPSHSSFRIHHFSNFAFSSCTARKSSEIPDFSKAQRARVKGRYVHAETEAHNPFYAAQKQRCRAVVRKGGEGRMRLETDREERAERERKREDRERSDGTEGFLRTL